MALTAAEKYRADHREEAKAYAKQYYVNNRQKMIAAVAENRKKKLKLDPDYLKKSMAKRKAANPEKFKTWARCSWVRRRFGLSVEQYDSLLKAQNYKCQICEADITDRKNYALDHCHVSGKIRGFLCKRCNSGMGFFDDNPILIMKAHNYLKEHE